MNVKYGYIINCKKIYLKKYNFKKDIPHKRINFKI